MESSIKVRQLISKGPQDLLYCSYTNLDEKSDSIFDLSKLDNPIYKNSNDVKDNLEDLEEISINTVNIELVAANEHEITEPRRICSRSYTKITDFVNNRENYGCDTQPPVKSFENQILKTSNLNINGAPMSKSVIVTSSSSSYKRMTRSTISRQNSK